MSLENVKVYQISDFDSVAARSLKEALDFYQDLTGLFAPDIYEYHQIEEVSKDRLVYCDESKTSMISVREVLEKYWEGNPFIVFSYL